MDNIGPGTRAWGAFDLYLAALRDGSNSRLIATRKAYLARSLTLVGRADMLPAWLQSAMEQRVE